MSYFDRIMFILWLNPIHGTGLFLHHLRYQKFFSVITGCGRRPVAWNGLFTNSQWWLIQRWKTIVLYFHIKTIWVFFLSLVSKVVLYWTHYESFSLILLNIILSFQGYQPENDLHCLSFIENCSTHLLCLFVQLRVENY